MIDIIYKVDWCEKTIVFHTPKPLKELTCVIYRLRNAFKTPNYHEYIGATKDLLTRITSKTPRGHLFKFAYGSNEHLYQTEFKNDKIIHVDVLEEIGNVDEETLHINESRYIRSRATEIASIFYGKEIPLEKVHKPKYKQYWSVVLKNSYLT